MFPRKENQNEGTFGYSSRPKTGTRVRSHVPPERKPKGIAKGGVKNRNKGGCKRLFAFVHVCSRLLALLAFSPLRLLAFVSVCLRLFAFARICLRPPLLRPPLRDTENRNEGTSVKATLLRNCPFVSQ